MCDRRLLLYKVSYVSEILIYNRIYYLLTRKIAKLKIPKRSCMLIAYTMYSAVTLRENFKLVLGLQYIVHLFYLKK